MSTSNRGRAAALGTALLLSSISASAETVSSLRVRLHPYVAGWGELPAGAAGAAFDAGRHYAHAERQHPHRRDRGRARRSGRRERGARHRAQVARRSQRAVGRGDRSVRGQAQGQARGHEGGGPAPDGADEDGCAAGRCGLPGATRQATWRAGDVRAADRASGRAEHPARTIGRATGGDGPHDRAGSRSAIRRSCARGACVRRTQRPVLRGAMVADRQRGRHQRRHRVDAAAERRGRHGRGRRHGHPPASRISKAACCPATTSSPMPSARATATAAIPIRATKATGRRANAAPSPSRASSTACSCPGSSPPTRTTASASRASPPTRTSFPCASLGTCGGTFEDIFAGVLWASGVNIAGVPANQNPAKIINLSLGGFGPCDQSIQEAVDDAIAHGAVVVVAAGNSSLEASDFAPANCSGVITVGAHGAAGRSHELLELRSAHRPHRAGRRPAVQRSHRRPALRRRDDADESELRVRAWHELRRTDGVGRRRAAARARRLAHERSRARSRHRNLAPIPGGLAMHRAQRVRRRHARRRRGGGQRDPERRDARWRSQGRRVLPRGPRPLLHQRRSRRNRRARCERLGRLQAHGPVFLRVPRPIGRAGRCKAGVPVLRAAERADRFALLLGQRRGVPRRAA